MAHQAAGGGSSLSLSFSDGQGLVRRLLNNSSSATLDQTRLLKMVMCGCAKQCLVDIPGAFFRLPAGVVVEVLVT